jgi:phosphoribosylformylglycinamidine synthase
MLHDRMTECVYESPLSTFDSGDEPKCHRVVPVLEEGIGALRGINTEMGLGFDEVDINYYYDIFVYELQRNPTDVECFDLGQSNSEHSRHWFFGGKMTIDGEEMEETLFDMVKATLDKGNSIISYHDNSSSIRGYAVRTLESSAPGSACALLSGHTFLHPLLTAETHNFPTGVAPFAGAETGTGGRLRDVQATGRGANTLAGVSAYCFGNLHIPGYPLPWEPSKGSPDAQYPTNLATPLDIALGASNGASDYGNKYGEPVIAGFTRSFGQRLPSGERAEFVKPIMFTAGIGSMDARHAAKMAPELDMVVCKMGGPAYRIGMGGGAASSRMQSAEDAALDFNAVQRGDAEMGNRMNRVVRTCIQLGDRNPIVSIHDQGAGGNGNVLKELVDPLGARYELRKLPRGDPTMSALELWGAEYQENNAFLVHPDRLEEVLAIGVRENCPVSPVGTVTGDGRVTARDDTGATPFDLPLSLVLGKMPQKQYSFDTPLPVLRPLVVRSDLGVGEALDRVLRLPDVGSKRWLTTKVDRSVSGLIAQQQCVGPLHTPLADVAVVALSHLDTRGIATAVGEQPIKGLIDSAAQARMTAGEALTNLMFARISAGGLKDVKASCNWMWAAKMEGEGAKMWHACAALKECLSALGPGIDGGKDSLSMAAKIGSETVKSPGQVTLTLYSACADITMTVNPALQGCSRDGDSDGESKGKQQRGSTLLYIDLSCGKTRMGGTAFSTVFSQLGDESPDMDQPAVLKSCFEVMQGLLERRVLLAGHDRSDGGLIVTLVEMALAGNLGIEVDLPVPTWDATAAAEGEAESYGPPNALLAALFSEELGLVVEVLAEHEASVFDAFNSAIPPVPCSQIGRVLHPSDVGGQDICISANGTQVYKSSVALVRDTWEATSCELDARQCQPACVHAEREYMLCSGPGKGPTYSCNFVPAFTSLTLLALPAAKKHRVAVVRQEGSNGDREMHAAFHLAGFEVWDVNMNDLLLPDDHAGALCSLDIFRGLVFVGGFSYADVNGSAKGWAAAIRFNPSLSHKFEEFRTRPDTFSLGVCNGCQLMALLGWVPFPSAHAKTTPGSMSNSIEEHNQPRFVHNTSGRFESRWSTVSIQPSASVLLRGMAGCQLGVWVAHGEGRAYFPNASDLNVVERMQLAPLRYTDTAGKVTESYPSNPNGSTKGIAGLISEDGRHLALMPHPERCVLLWQCPHYPKECIGHDNEAGMAGPSPWLKMFQNAREFCDSVP